MTRLVRSQVKLVRVNKGPIFISERDSDNFVLSMASDTDEDFGHPDVITVTIEPGDLLNDAMRGKA